MSDKIVEAALGWVDTPYHHQARVKGVGVDCAQLIAGIAEETGHIAAGTPIPFNYSTEWHLHNREEQLLQNLEAFGCTRKEGLNPEPGDILCFQYGRAVSHLGVYVGNDMFVHAANNLGKVALNTLSPETLKRLKFIYIFPTHPRGLS